MRLNLINHELTSGLFLVDVKHKSTVISIIRNTIAIIITVTWVTCHANTPTGQKKVLLLEELRSVF